MRYGRGMSGACRRSSISPTICPMNCTRIRVTISASITVPSEKKPATIEMRAEHEQRDVREVLRRMQPPEHAEEVAALRRRVRDARVAEQQREHRAERGPQHEQREHRRDASIRRSSP